MRKGILLGAVLLNGSLYLGGTAAARTLASASVGDALTPATMVTCTLSNIGTKPVKILSAQVLDVAGVDITSGDGCSMTSLAAGASCGMNAGVSFSGRGIVKVKGSTANLRGACSLFSSNGLLGIIDMR